MEFVLKEKFYLPIVYIVIGMLLYSLLKKVTNKLSRHIKTSKGITKRKDTIVSLINNLIKYIIAIFIILSILKVYGVDTSSIVASLGIIAAIVGLAFQDILKDLFAGISIIFDNLYAIGDYISVNGFTGEVIDLGLKTTKIKSYTGEVKMLSNSVITEVTNYSLEQANLVLDINVSYNTDIDKLENILQELNEKVSKYEEVTGKLELLGIEELASSSVVYRVAIKCKPMSQYGLKRKLLKLIKQELDKNHIEIPYSKLDVNVRRDKSE